MPDIIITGPEGRLEGKLNISKNPEAPIALLLHPHPQHGGTMNNKVVFEMYRSFAKKGFTTLRFNFRGVGSSEGSYGNGEGELIDASAALDWLQAKFRSHTQCWIAGFSFGSWIGLQLLMRRPDIANFIAISPPANKYDFSFLSPAPNKGLIIQGTQDEIVPEESVTTLYQKLSQQKNVSIDYKIIKGANHFFDQHKEQLAQEIESYIDREIAKASK